MPVLADVTADDPERITVTTEFQHRELTKTLPGAKWSAKDGAWKLPLAWTSCLALRSTFKEALVVQPGLHKWSLNEYANRIMPANKLRGALTLDEIDLGTMGPAVKTAKEVAEGMELYKHQAAGAAFMAVTEQCLIADETGTGKSAQAIAAVRTINRIGGDPWPVLVVAPNSVKMPWKREWERWWPGIQVSLISGGAAQRRKAFETPAHVYIINWDILYKHSRLAKYGNMALKRCTACGGLDERINSIQCEVHLKELNYLKFNTVIADEVHRGKAPSAKQTRALWGAAEHAKYRFGMTGTPIQDTIEDLWSILHFLSPEEYSAKTKFMDRFAETGYNMWGAFTVFGIKDAARDEFFAGVDPRMRRMLKKAVLDLPPILRETRYVEMPPAQAKAYKQMKKETIAELESGDTLVAASPLSRATRLLQFASSYAELETRELPDGRVESKAKLSLPSGKINQFLADIAAGDFGDSSIVVFAQSRQLIELLSDEMRRKDIAHGLITGAQSTEERQESIDDFQAGKTKYVLVTIAAGGVGLTLTAADTMVFLQRAWSSTGMVQAESRAHRIGSEIHERVTIVNYVTADTIEEQQTIRLGEKYGRIEAVVRDREMLKSLLMDEDLPEDITLPTEAELAAVDEETS